MADRKKWTLAILAFPLGQNMSAKLLQQVHDLFLSVAKIVALPRRDNLQVLQVCQMTSITSFEPLSPVVALKFGALHWRKLFIFFQHSLASEHPIFLHF